MKEWHKHLFFLTKGIKEDFHFYNERWKLKIAFSVCFAVSCSRSSVHPSRESGPVQRLPQKVHAVSHLQGSIGMNCLWASVLHLCLFSASVTQVCPKVTASLLFHTSALQRFHRQALPLENGGNLHSTWDALKFTWMIPYSVFFCHFPFLFHSIFLRPLSLDKYWSSSFTAM